MVSKSKKKASFSCALARDVMEALQGKTTTSSAVRAWVSVIEKMASTPEDQLEDQLEDPSDDSTTENIIFVDSESVRPPIGTGERMDASRILPSPADGF